MNDRQPSTIERHAQTIIAGVLLILVTWVGSTVVDIRDRVARIEERQLDVAGWKADFEQRLRTLEKGSK